MARTLPGEAKQKVLEAAVPLFSKNGYTATSIRDIANAAGVNQNTIFRIFRDKYSLYLEMFAMLSQQWRFFDRVEAAMRAAPDDQAALVADMRAFTQLLQEYPDSARLFLFVGLESPEFERRMLQEAVAPLYRLVADRIRHGIESGIFRDVNPMIAARALFAIHYYHHVLGHIFGADHVPELAVGDPVEEYCRIWLDGISRRDA